MKATAQCLVMAWMLIFSTRLEGGDRPNVLFIAIDDQNDWIGAFGGHPLAKKREKDDAKSCHVGLQILAIIDIGAYR